METKQPTWKYVANIGDVNPLDYGGCFVYEDTTRVYGPEMTVLETNDNALDAINSCCDIEEPCKRHAGFTCWRAYRILLEPCTYQNGILSDNPYHKDKPVWFAGSLEHIALFCGLSADELRAALCGADILARAHAYKVLTDYHGATNFDSYPDDWSASQRAEVIARFSTGVQK